MADIICGTQIGLARSGRPSYIYVLQKIPNAPRPRLLRRCLHSGIYPAEELCKSVLGIPRIVPEPEDSGGVRNGEIGILKKKERKGKTETQRNRRSNSNG